MHHSMVTQDFLLWENTELPVPSHSARVSLGWTRCLPWGLWQYQEKKVVTIETAEKNSVSVKSLKSNKITTWIIIMSNTLCWDHICVKKMHIYIIYIYIYIYTETSECSHMSSFPMVVVVVFGCICVWWCLRSKPYTSKIFYLMGLLPDTQNCGLRRYRECRERFPHHRLQMKPLVSDPGSAVMHVGIANPWWRENIPDILGACATRNFAYLVGGMPMILCLIFFHIPIKVLYNLNAFSVTVY